MNISRGFLLMGSLYLLVGITFGMYMGGSGDHTLAPVHAHINLLGFTLMTLFGLGYRLIPAMAANRLATVHFWLHQVGVACLLFGLFLMMSGRVAETTIGPLFPIFEIAIFVGIATWAYNLYRNC